MDSPDRLWRVRSQRALVVVGTLIGLEAIVFFANFAGTSVPQFDFIGAYNLEAYAWWKDGSFFSPTQWMPYMWGGYPAVSNLQNSSFYLPVGVMAAVVPFTLQASAILSALHVAFGALGTYTFARAFGLHHYAALAGLVSWFFAVGFYSNATHLDIMRAYAWVPWMMLVLSPRWRWSTWWAFPLAVLILWQGALGMYPGMLASGAYALGVWVVLSQIVLRPQFSRYLLPLLVTGIAAIAMMMLRYLPALVERGVYPSVIPDTSAFGFRTLASAFFPETAGTAGALGTMGMYFLPISLLALLPYVPWRAPLARSLVGVFTVSSLIGLPFWPWHDLVAQLPGMSVSRFRASDFKVYLLFALCLLAVLALDSLIRGQKPVRTRVEAADGRGWLPTLIRQPEFWRVGSLAALVLGALALSVRYSSNPQSWLVQFEILLASATIVVAASIRCLLLPRRALAVGVAVLALMSGTHYVFGISGEWVADRAAVEQEYLGGSIDSFLQQRASDPEVRQRPARAAVPEKPTGEDSIAREYGSAFYTGHDSFFGYVNLRGTETFEMVKASAYLPGDLGTAARAFWTAPGLVVQSGTDSLPTLALVESCATQGDCGPGLSTTAVEYSPGTLVYDVRATANVSAVLNEASYAGWAAQLCPFEGSTKCESVETSRGTAGQIEVNIPKGTWQLKLKYELPMQAASWGLFFGGWALIALSMLVVALRRPGRNPVGSIQKL